MHKISSPFTKLLAGILLLFSISIYCVTSISKNYSNTILSIPSITRINLPPPLQLATLSSSILGAQTFNAADIVTYVNIEREKRGIVPLRINTILTKAAQKRADVILKYQNFSHQDPYENIELASVVPEFGYHYMYASENIGMGGISGDDFVKGFMNSTSHRENLLNKDLVDTGIALVTGQYQNYYVNIAVEIFAIPATKEEYLGYTVRDVQKYKNLLSNTELQLNPLIWHINNVINSSPYSDKKYQKLQRQNEILSQLYFQMIQEKQFTTFHLNLIYEFNKIQSQII